jgi:CDP-paratose synthetase
MKKAPHGILVTGATGFIGSHFVNHLQQYEDITIIIRPESNLERLDNLTSNLKIIKMDIKENWLNELENLQKIKPLQIVHFATTYTGEAEINKSNIEIPIKIMETLKNPDNHTFINTDTFFGKSLSTHSGSLLYTKSKHEFLKQAKKISNSQKIKLINMRLEHIYGKKDNPRKFIPWLFKNLISNTENIELTNCEHIRDFLHVSDTITAYTTVLANLDKIDTNTEISVGSGVGITVKDFVLLAKKILYSNSNLDFGKIEDRGDIKYSIGNTTYLNSLGWKPIVSLETGIKDLFASIINNV